MGEFAALHTSCARRESLITPVFGGGCANILLQKKVSLIFSERTVHALQFSVFLEFWEPDWSVDSDFHLSVLILLHGVCQ